MKTIILVSICLCAFIVSTSGQEKTQEDFLFKQVLKALTTENYSLITDNKMPFDKILTLAVTQHKSKLVRDLQAEQFYKNGKEVGLQQLDEELKIQVNSSFELLHKNISPNVLDGATYLRTEYVIVDWGLKPWESTQKVFTFFKNFLGDTYCMLTYQARAMSQVFTVKVENEFAEATTVKAALVIFEPVSPTTNETEITVVKTDNTYNSSATLNDSSALKMPEAEEPKNVPLRIINPAQVSHATQLAGYFDDKKQQWISRSSLYKTIKFNTGNELAIFNSYGKEGDFIGMGLIDKKGNIIAPAIYEQLYHYPEYKIYIVYLKNKRGIFNEEGLQIVAPQYNYISEIAEQDLLRVEKNDMVGYINLKGKIIIPVKYIDVVLAGEGLMAFTLKPQKWGYINYEDKVIIEPMFTFAAPFEDGKCILQKEDGKEYTVYTDGRVIKVVD